MTSRRFPPDLSDTTPLEAGDAARHRSAVGSGIYFSADRRDIQYAVTELVRHMAMPRRCDMNQAMMLGKPGLPATSSPDAELRGISRACVLDFGLEVEVEVPRIWSDSSASITAAKRVGPGTKLRHVDVSEFYVQGAV